MATQQHLVPTSYSKINKIHAAFNFNNDCGFTHYISLPQSYNSYRIRMYIFNMSSNIVWHQKEHKHVNSYQGNTLTTFESGAYINTNIDSYPEYIKAGETDRNTANYLSLVLTYQHNYASLLTRSEDDKAWSMHTAEFRCGRSGGSYTPVPITYLDNKFQGYMEIEVE